jgi:hypothetical protein
MVPLPYMIVVHQSGNCFIYGIKIVIPALSAAGYLIPNSCRYIRIRIVFWYLPAGGFWFFPVDIILLKYIDMLIAVLRAFDRCFERSEKTISTLFGLQHSCFHTTNIRTDEITEHRFSLRRWRTWKRNGWGRRRRRRRFYQWQMFAEARAERVKLSLKKNGRKNAGLSRCFFETTAFFFFRLLRFVVTELVTVSFRLLNYGAITLHDSRSSVRKLFYLWYQNCNPGIIDSRMFDTKSLPVH